MQRAAAGALEGVALASAMRVTVFAGLGGDIVQRVAGQARDSLKGTQRM